MSRLPLKTRLRKLDYAPPLPRAEHPIRWGEVLDSVALLVMLLPFLAGLMATILYALLAVLVRG